MSVRRFLLLGSLLALSAALLPAQEAALQQRLDARTAAEVGAVIDSARAAGLPTRPLVSKALEGASKRAPGPRIVAAVRTLAGELRTARTVLGAVSETELDAAASALHLGVRQRDLATLRSAREGERLTVPLAVLADLVAYGVPAPAATQAVIRLAAAEDEELLEFRRDVERDIALGAPPEAAAAIRLNSGARVTDALTSGEGPPRGASPAPPRKP